MLLFLLFFPLVQPSFFFFQADLFFDNLKTCICRATLAQRETQERPELEDRREKLYEKYTITYRIEEEMGTKLNVWCFLASFDIVFLHVFPTLIYFFSPAFALSLDNN